MNLSAVLAQISDPAAAAADIRRELERRRAENKLREYRPYRKQLMFHAAGLEHRERLFMAANQIGKSLAGCAEDAIHLTGLYPDWWPGFRYTKAPRMWVAGVTSESTRDTIQRLLVGPPEDENRWGTGLIPKDRMVGPQRSRGVPNSLDSVMVKWSGGGVSTVLFKSYERGREKWQGDTVDGVHFDEECPYDIYMEGLTRTNATGGKVWMTFTPLLGRSPVVDMFIRDDVGGYETSSAPTASGAA